MSDFLDKYPSPKPGNTLFTKYWDSYLPDLMDRENFKTSHLIQLKILCSLCAEYDELDNFIELYGRTYDSVGRNGLQIKARAEVALMKTCIAEIRNYSKMLGLVLVRDTALTNVREEKNEFD